LDPNLSDWLAEASRRVDWRLASDWLITLAGELSPPHARGECHGAISTESISIHADLATGPHSVTLSPGGSQHQSFLAPEQVDAAVRCCPRSDVYSLGVVFYRLLGHRLPFRSPDRQELTREILQDDPQPPRQLDIDIPASVERVCLAMLAKDPAARPANAAVLLQDLRDALSEAEPASRGAIPQAGGVRRADAARAPCLLVSGRAVVGSAETVEATLASRLGTVLRRSGSTWVLRPHASGNAPLTPREVLTRTLSTLRQLADEGQAGVFVVELADDDTLNHRPMWVRTRVAPGRVFLEPVSVSTVRRWVPEADRDETGHRWVIRSGSEHLTLFVDATILPTDERPLVGRTATLAILNARWDQASEGLGQTVLLCGPAGTGKTRLVRELKRHAFTGRWVEWTCLPGRATHLADPAVRFFADALACGTETERRQAEATTAVSPRDRWHRSLTDWLKSQTALGPTAFVVEDIHWADPVTLTFLHSLVELEVRDRLLIVFTARPEFESPWGSRANQTLITLSRLTRRQAADLYSGVTGMTAPSALLDELMAASGGIPQSVEGFAEAVLRANPDHPTPRPHS
jgi:hypothetical protein